MKRGSLWLIVLALALGLFFGVAALYRLRISRGDVFPAYSSLRADPLGVRALHDAAQLLPERDVVRWMRPLERLQAGVGDVVLVVGLEEGAGSGFDEDEWAALDGLAIGGARVVVAWHAQTAQPNDNQRTRDMRADPWLLPPEKKKSKSETAETPTAENAEKKDTPTDAKTKPAKTAGKPKKLTPHYATPHERRLGFRLGRRELVQHNAAADALKDAAAPASWPATLTRWRSDLFFMPRDSSDEATMLATKHSDLFSLLGVGRGWQVLYRRGTEPVMIERVRGKGSITLLADSFVLSNEAVQRERATPLLADLLGDAKRVVFVESHLGVEIDSGVAVLARRYGLGGAALTALVLAGLWIWRSATPLTPIFEENEEVQLSVAPTAGLEALLRRAVPPAKLFASCIEAWRPNATAGDQRRLAGTPPADTELDPVAAYNTTTRTLSPKRIP